MSARHAETLAIGSELLGPERIDTNGSFLARLLGERGIAVRFRTVVGDDPADLKEAFRIALGRADVVIATGGLGPTVDDLTREAVAELLSLPLVEDAALVRELEERFRSIGRVMAATNRRQAMVPRGAEVLPNALGSAPGLLLRPDGKYLALLPGVPSEMARMAKDVLMPRLPAAEDRFAHRVLRIAGLTESDVDQRLQPVWKSAGDVQWTILAGAGQIEIHLRERVPRDGVAANLDRLDAAAAAILGGNLFGRDDDTLASVVARRLLERGAWLAVAESITAGGVARRLAEVPGASRWLRGGAVVYTDAAKTALAGVPPEILAKHGAISAETARALAEGIRARLGSDWGLATTGLAGPPAPGDPGPPGTIHLAVAGAEGVRERRLLLPGDRGLVLARAAQAAIDLLRRALEGTAS
jgi:nicotinamide-nucleotide amidase